MGRRRGAPSGYAREVDEGGGPAREGGVCWVGHPALLGRVEKRVESPHPQWAGGAVHPAAISGVLMNGGGPASQVVDKWWTPARVMGVGAW